MTFSPAELVEFLDEERISREGSLRAHQKAGSRADVIAKIEEEVAKYQAAARFLAGPMCRVEASDDRVSA